MLKLILYSIISIGTVVVFDVFGADVGKNQLPACPNKPNCVSSMSNDAQSSIEPFHYTGEPDVAKQLLANIIKQQPRAEIIKQDGYFLHSAFTSLIFRFVDDVVFLFVDNEKLIHVRSASRSGYSDFGVNRKRVEMLRKEFKAQWDRKNRK